MQCRVSACHGFAAALVGAHSTWKGHVAAPAIGQGTGSVAVRPIAPDAHAAAAAAAAATALRNFHADHVVSCQLFNVVLFQLFLALTALAAACGLAPNVQRFALAQNVLEIVASHATIVCQTVSVVRCLQHRVYIEDPPCGVQRVCTMGLKHSWRWSTNLKLEMSPKSGLCDDHNHPKLAVRVHLKASNQMSSIITLKRYLVMNWRWAPP